MTMPEPKLTDELRNMESEYEPLLPIESKLIWYTFSGGIVLLIALVLLGRWFVK
jgi:hypothetical protein